MAMVTLAQAGAAEKIASAAARSEAGRNKTERMVGYLMGRG
jgi:hypothetical protein